LKDPLTPSSAAAAVGGKINLFTVADMLRCSNQNGGRTRHMADFRRFAQCGGLSDRGGVGAAAKLKNREAE
jgi:hypothetical protein